MLFLEGSTALRTLFGTTLAIRCGQRGGGMWLLPGSTSPLSPWRSPRVCTVWNEGFLRIIAPWIYVRPGAYVYWLAGWSQKRHQGGVDRELRSPRLWNFNSYDLDPAVVLPVDGVQVALKRVLVVTLARASRQTLAAAVPFLFACGSWRRDVVWWLCLG